MVAEVSKRQLLMTGFNISAILDICRLTVRISGRNGPASGCRNVGHLLIASMARTRYTASPSDRLVHSSSRVKRGATKTPATSRATIRTTNSCRRKVFQSSECPSSFAKTQLIFSSTWPRVPARFRFRSALSARVTAALCWKIPVNSAPISFFWTSQNVAFSCEMFLSSS